MEGRRFTLTFSISTCMSIHVLASSDFIHVYLKGGGEIILCTFDNCTDTPRGEGSFTSTLLLHIVKKSSAEKVGEGNKSLWLKIAEQNWAAKSYVNEKWRCLYGYFLNFAGLFFLLYIYCFLKNYYVSRGRGKIGDDEQELAIGGQNPMKLAALSASLTLSSPIWNSMYLIGKKMSFYFLLLFLSSESECH